MTSTTLYAIKRPDGIILPYPITPHKHTCAYSFTKSIGEGPWDMLKKQGYKCVKVEIREVEE